MSRVEKAVAGYARIGDKAYPLCAYCGEPILRNLARLNGATAWHYGCLKRSHAKPTHLCLNCFSYLTKAQLVRTYFEDGTSEASCGNCGSPEIKPLTRWEVVK
jgi:hypothetical protein